MSQGNILFLICRPCEQAKQPDFGVKLAGRTQRGYYSHLVPSKQLDNWLMQHRQCGGRTGPDHFQLGYLAPHNHDQSELAAAVKLAVAH